MKMSEHKSKLVPIYHPACMFTNRASIGTTSCLRLTPGHPNIVSGTHVALVLQRQALQQWLHAALLRHQHHAQAPLCLLRSLGLSLCPARARRRRVGGAARVQQRSEVVWAVHGYHFVGYGGEGKRLDCGLRHCAPVWPRFRLTRNEYLQEVIMRRSPPAD